MGPTRRFITPLQMLLIVTLVVVLGGSVLAGLTEQEKKSLFQGIRLIHPKQGQTLIEDSVGIEWSLAGLEEAKAEDLAVKLDDKQVISISYKKTGRILYLPQRLKEGDHEVEIVLTMDDNTVWRDSVSFRYETPVADEMVEIPKGRFLMGCSPDDTHCEDDEMPRHEVMIDAFSMNRTEVTNWQYQRCVDAERCTPSYYHKNPFWVGPNHPVVAVTWENAQAYCHWKGGRLPTEAEWEYAARAGTESSRYGPLDSIAWHRGNSDGRTHRVGQKRPNALGLYDMLGNVWEWCQDFYNPIYYQQSPTDNPHNQRSASERVLRGGDWYFDSVTVRVSNRNHVMGNALGSNGGFRCVGPIQP